MMVFAFISLFREIYGVSTFLVLAFSVKLAGMSALLAVKSVFRADLCFVYLYKGLLWERLKS